MSTLLVSDTSVLIDLDRGGLLHLLFGLPFRIAVPDVLFRRELEEWRGPSLLEFGLEVVELDEDGVASAQRYLSQFTGVSTSDVFALVLAKSGNHTLLTGDSRLKAIAAHEHVECHGLLWVLDQFERDPAVDHAELLSGLERIQASHRVRLPAEEVRERLERYRRRAGGN